MNKQKTFEEFLEDKFSEEFTGSKDGWEVSLDIWFAQLDVQEVIDYAEEWGYTIFEAGKLTALKELSDRMVTNG